MRFEGHVRSWNNQRGFGFIEVRQGEQPVFVHIKAFADRSAPPGIGQAVTFEIAVGANGKKRAIAVQTPGAPRRARNHSPAQWGTARLFALPGFLLIYLVTDILWRVPGWVAVGYLVLSILCFVFYAIDKSAAKAGGRRTPEATLLLLGCAGGWPGAMLAQQLLRHKSNKAAFQSVFGASVMVNVGLFVALSSPLPAWTLARSGL
ncbi:MAG: cold shock and DUF1294 domain-containing protein [Herminiimonas sp.]|nr:cold shock and DUF1294 domain-containing protein [Herminiimonas sp.]